MFPIQNAQCLQYCGKLSKVVGATLFNTDYLTACYHHVTYEFESESTLYSVPECQGNPCSKQVPYLRFK